MDEIGPGEGRLDSRGIEIPPKERHPRVCHLWKHPLRHHFEQLNGGPAGGSRRADAQSMA